MQVTVDPEYLERFTHTLADLGISGNDHILLAVSGGPDSLALLLLAHQWTPERIVAATVDHQLRAESADEATYVGQICKNLGIRHVTLVPAEPITGNIQSSARSVRYVLLAEAANAHGCAFIATAHHGDDQLETLFMRLARGSGIDGLASIRARNGDVIRPLLGFSKLELEEICTNSGIRPVRDPSNDNPDFDRVAIRQWLERSSHPFQIQRIGRTVQALAQSAEALAWAAKELTENRIAHENNEIQCDSDSLPQELKRRLLLHCLTRLEPELKPRGEAIDRLLAELEAGKTSMIGNIMCKGGASWHFSVAPARRSDR